MISLREFVKYIGLTVIIWCLLNAFNTNLNNQEMGIMLLSIIAVIYLLLHKKPCSKKAKKTVEEYQFTAPPLVDSIYPQKDNTDSKPAQPIPFINKEYADDDVKDFKDIMAIDKKTYKKILDNEQHAMNVIQNRQTNEMVYTTTHPFNTVPLGTQLYGYTYLPPENWFRAYERPPVCVTDKRCPVCPTSYNGTADLMQFDASNNVMGPDGIDLRYVKKRLNKDK